MSKQLDMTPQPDLSQKTGTGPVRTRLPVWRPALPPCNHACPAGENIQAWLALAEAGRFEAAWQTLIEDNPAACGPWPGLLSPLRERLQPGPGG